MSSVMFRSSRYGQFPEIHTSHCYGLGLFCPCMSATCLVTLTAFRSPCLFSAKSITRLGLLPARLSISSLLPLAGASLLADALPKPYS